MKTVIIGGGPAGLTAACFSPHPTVVLERLSAPARKLLATGGGRCNLTHATDARGIASAFHASSRFLAPALHAFPPKAIRDFFQNQGVETVADPDGCVFPLSQRASDIAQALIQAAQRNGADIRCGVRATGLIVTPAAAAAAPPFLRITGVQTSEGLIPADRVILAAGGQSYPDLGSDGSGFRLAQNAGLSITQPIPALSGVSTQETWPGTLAGILVETGGIRIDTSTRFLTGPVLFTHKGLSGPPVLDLSGEIAFRLLSSPSLPLRLTFNANRNAEQWLKLFDAWRTRHGGRSLHNLLAGEMPRTLALTLCGLSGLTDTAAARARRSTLQTLANTCTNLCLHAADTEGWHRAMLTRGGVALSELNPATLACRRIRGLACAGEVVDVDGRCGGYNLTWAFASGRLAATAPSD